jgi:hypothetical protein
MSTQSDRLVPKIHPATRGVEAGDPMELQATALAGDPEVMLECLIQEYVWMGWDREHIVALFHSPFYPALNALLEHYGEYGIQARVGAVLGRMGLFRVSGTVREEPETEVDEPELIPLGTRRVLAPKGDRHARGL